LEANGMQSALRFAGACSSTFTWFSNNTAWGNFGVRVAQHNPSKLSRMGRVQISEDMMT